MEFQILFTAIGSIGSRHLNNLVKIAKKNGDTLQCDVLRKSNRKLPDELKRHIRREIYEKEAIGEWYDAVFITSPTACHYNEIQEWKKKTEFLFIEKPVLGRETVEIATIMPKPNQNFYVAAPMRYTEVFRKLKQLTQTEQIYSARIICSSYMPEWQKNRDYRLSFRSKEENGGGVDLDLVHEIDYMIALFGMPKSVKRLAGKYSGLEMDACDLAVYLFEYQDKLVEMHLDYFGKKDQRYIELFTEKDIIRGDFLQKKVEFLSSGQVIEFNEAVDHYEREIEQFYELLKTKNRRLNINPVEYAWRSLQLSKGEIQLEREMK